MNNLQQMLPSHIVIEMISVIASFHASWKRGEVRGLKNVSGKCRGVGYSQK